MNIYQSEFLNISKRDETLVQSWTEKLISVEDYKNELNHFMDLFYKVKPTRLVLDITKCRLEIPEEIEDWMVGNILIPINKRGIKKLAFTIADDTAAHFSIAARLEKAKPIIQSVYFSSLNEATHYSEYKKNTSTSPKPPKLESQLKRNSDSFDISLNIESNSLPQFLISMRQIEKDGQFIEDHMESYYSLTIREVEVFKLIALGKTNKQIALCLFIEESSVKSHRKNIKRKLKITSIFDIYQYARCFQVV